MAHSVVRAEACFREIHVRDSSDQIVGATVVASHAGEIISDLTIAMVGKLGFPELPASHPYPTLAEGIRLATLATPTTAAVSHRASAGRSASG